MVTPSIRGHQTRAERQRFRFRVQENEVMLVAFLCDTAVPALGGSGHISPDDAFKLKLFELELKIQQQAHSLAKKSQGIVQEG